MKINQPVTNREKDVRVDQNLLSTTDLKGAIAYVSPDFIEISGFTQEELLRKNHNIVRHPDMPPQAFESLWSSVKSGRPWMGIVKNRCKDGDHYWVDAFVMPIQRDGATVEYQSVRYKADRRWVERAEASYKRLLAGKGFRLSLSARLGLGNKLILGHLMALSPALIFALLPELSGMAPLGLGLSAILGVAVNFGLMRPFRGRLIRRERSTMSPSCGASTPGGTTSLARSSWRSKCSGRRFRRSSAGSPIPPGSWRRAQRRTPPAPSRPGGVPRFSRAS